MRGIFVLSAQSFIWTENNGLEIDQRNGDFDYADIVFYFFDKKLAQEINVYDIVKKQYPDAIVFGCSSSDAVCGSDIYPDAITGIAIHFEKTSLAIYQSTCQQQSDSFDQGKAMAEALMADDLAHIFVITDALNIHGSQFLNGAHSVLPRVVQVSGGMASDALEFKETLVGINSEPQSNKVCAIGFYGDSIRIGCGADGGWKKFGIQRVITKSEGNILYELDNKPALDLYKAYLGTDVVDKLPGSGALFPLGIQENENSDIIIRTMDCIYEENNSIRFSGDIPKGYISHFMTGHISSFEDGASNAAKIAIETLPDVPKAALMVSCCGRQLAMGVNIINELSALVEVISEDIPMAGFYSFGEFSQRKGSEKSIYHNQTMTLTLLAEI